MMWCPPPSFSFLHLDARKGDHGLQTFPLLFPFFLSFSHFSSPAQGTGGCLSVCVCLCLCVWGRKERKKGTNLFLIKSFSSTIFFRCKVYIIWEKRPLWEICNLTLKYLMESRRRKVGHRAGTKTDGRACWCIYEVVNSQPGRKWSFVSPFLSLRSRELKKQLEMKRAKFS